MTQDKAGNIIPCTDPTYSTWRNVCPLRFVMRDGKRILQSPHECLETHQIEWRDVPLMEEK